MKTAALLLLCFVFTANFCSGQNLVPNPSFEEYDVCPPGLDYIENATGWISAGGTPDYFTKCAPFINGNSASAPCNGFGCQEALSGDSYAGFWAKAESSDYREYLGATLLSNLQVGVEYYVSLKINLSPYSYTAQYCGVNKLGILFSTTPYNITTPAPRNNHAQVYTQNIVIDTANWVTVKGSFVADSSYSFISIGNFFSHALTDSIQISGTSCNAYYFVDDVCVSFDSVYCNNYSYTGLKGMSNINVSVYPNPTIDALNIDLTGLSGLYHVIIADAVGSEKVARSVFGGVIERISVAELPQGIFFCKVISKNNSLNFKLIKHNL